MIEKCTLCGHAAEYSAIFERDISIFDCPRCGNYNISVEAETILNNSENEKTKYILSGIARYRTENELKPITILTENYEDLKEDYYVPRNISQKLDLLLRYISKKSEYAGDIVNIDVALNYPIAFCKNATELSFLLTQLELLGLLQNQDVGNVYSLTVSGWNKIEELKLKVNKKKQGFIAMWFKDELKDSYANGFSKAIKDTGFEPMRIDMKEHNNKIDDEIIAEIRNSAFLIADFTGQRGGVYFEAGFAMGLGIPVIWTCKDEDVNELHFDTRQFNHITWKNSEELYKKLLNRIKATIKIIEK